jgi:hypothetical protein
VIYTPASKIRAAAVALLQASSAPCCQRGDFLISADFDPDEEGRVRLRIRAADRVVFRAWWHPDDPDDLAAVVSHGDWEPKLMEAARYGQ